MKSNSQGLFVPKAWSLAVRVEGWQSFMILIKMGRPKQNIGYRQELHSIARSFYASQCGIIITPPNVVARNASP